MSLLIGNNYNEWMDLTENIKELMLIKHKSIFAQTLNYSPPMGEKRPHQSEANEIRLNRLAYYKEAWLLLP